MWVRVGRGGGIILFVSSCFILVLLFCVGVMYCKVPVLCFYCIK